MLKIKWLLALVLLVCPMAYSQTTAEKAVTAARAKAASLWGPSGTISQIGSGTSSWTYQVGVYSGGCSTQFTVLGSGNSWDAAFLNYTNRLQAGSVKIGGPYRGIVLLRTEASDDVGVVSFQHFIDAKAFGPAMLVVPPLTKWESVFSFDTSQLPNGFHVMCTQAVDGGGTIGYSTAVFLFRTDQTLPMFEPIAPQVVSPVGPPAP